MNSLFAQQLPESIIKTYSIRVKAVGGVNLGQGIPSFPTPDYIINAAKKALDEKDIGVYPNFLGTIELREAIAKKLEGESFQKGFSLKLDPMKEILVTIGAMEAVASSILSIINNDDVVGVVTPDYCNHFPAVMLARGIIHEIPMKEGTIWELDVKKIEKEAKQGMKLLMLTNPNNPTGAVIGRGQLKHIVSLSNHYGFWIVSDETYAFLDYSNTFASLLEFYDECERLLIVRTFSKEYAMTGWRVGYVMGKPDVMKLIAKTHDALVGCVPKISQIAAATAITGPQDHALHFRNILGKRRTLVCNLLDEMKEYLTYAKPQGAYYVFPRYKLSISSRVLTEQILKKAHVSTIPGSVFGASGEGHIRISFAVDDAVLVEGMKNLSDYLSRI